MQTPDAWKIHGAQTSLESMGSHSTKVGPCKLNRPWTHVLKQGKKSSMYFANLLYVVINVGPRSGEKRENLAIIMPVSCSKSAIHKSHSTHIGQDLQAENIVRFRSDNFQQDVAPLERAILGRLIQRRA